MVISLGRPDIVGDHRGHGALHIGDNEVSDGVRAIQTTLVNIVAV